MSFEKDTAYDIPFALLDVETGTAITGASVTGKRVLDGGAQESVSGLIVEKGNGQYLFEGSSGDFHADYSIGLLFSASGALPVHVIIQMQRFRKNTAYDLPFLLINRSTGAGLAGASPAGKRILDGGAQANVGGSFVERGGGQYVFEGVAADYNADDTAGFLFSATNAIPVHLTVDLEKTAPGSGTTLKEKIYQLLTADAQINDPSHLGGMLGLYVSEPYGVYFRNPPEGKDFDSYSVISYFINSMQGRFPRDIYVNVTAWGDNFDTILARCYDLLHNAVLTTSDYQVLMLKWDYAGPELYAEDHRTYFQQHRFLTRAIKI